MEYQEHVYIDCPNCGGTGTRQFAAPPLVPDLSCLRCHGRGQADLIHEFRVKAAARGIPEHMHDPIAQYVVCGGYVGDFLTALLSNDLKMSFMCADDRNQKAMREWVAFLYNDAPGASHGSEERIAAWQELGGIKGLLAKEALATMT